MAPPTPLVLDVDTGVDDACALLLAARHPAAELLAVTCVGGNAALPDVLRNTLTVLESCGRGDVPVSAGATRPLLEARRGARHVHGEDGMGDLGLAPPNLAPDRRHAVELLRDVATSARSAGRPVTLVPLAPLTNIALLARAWPDAFAALDRVVFMGGAANVGNATASAEFNVFHDPEAAAIVLDACAEHRVPVTMYGLDVFYQPTVPRAVADRLVAEAGRLGSPRDIGGRLVRFQCTRFGRDEATIGDAGAVCAVLAPELLSTRRVPVRVELAGTWTRGRTIVDLRDGAVDLANDPHGLARSVVDVALGVDGPAYAGMWLDALEAG